jgi:hypothetical protein
MAKVLHVREWVSLVRQFGGTPKRDTVVGVSITLAAWLLGVSRSRVHQLLKGRKLSAVDVYDERHVRIGHLSRWPLSLIGDASCGRGAPSGNQRARNSLRPDFRQGLCHVRGQHSSY